MEREYSDTPHGGRTARTECVSVRRAQAILLSLCLLASSCSSAPKNASAIYERRNEAAQALKSGDSFFKAGNFNAALAQYESALLRNTAVDFDEGVIASKISSGKVYLAARDYERAISVLEDAGIRAAAAGLPVYESQALSLKAQTLLRTGKPAEAASAATTAKTLAGKDRKSLALALHSSGDASKETGDYKSAEANLLEAAKLNAELRDFSELASNYYLLAAVLVKTEKLDSALSYAKLALENDKLTENVAGIASDYFALGRISRRSGKNAEAKSYLRKSFEVALASDRVTDVRAALAELLDIAVAENDAEGKDKYGALLEKIK